MITNPEANPLVSGAANLFGLGGLGYFLLGQQRKAYITWAVVIIGGFCTFGALFLLCWVTAYDAYLLAQRLQQGETIGQTDNGLPFLDMVFR